LDNNFEGQDYNEMGICDFLQTAVAVTKEIVSGKIETVNTDGAYHSPENHEYCKENGIDLILVGIQGKPSRYDLSFLTST